MGAALIFGTLAGWLILYGISLTGPRLGRSRERLGRSRAGPRPPASGAEPPAVLSLLAGRPDRDGFAATLLGLSGRGWFELTSTTCVLPAEAPIEELTPYEHRAIAHVARRTGAHRETPPDALLDGYLDGEDEFMKAFRADVIADSRARGLTRPTLSGVRKTVLAVLALIPAGATLVAAHLTRHSVSLLPLAGFYYVILCVTAIKVSSERLTRDGQAVLAAREPDLPTAGFLASRAAGTAWSGYGDSWRLLQLGSPDERLWPGISVGAFLGIVLLLIPGTPVLTLVGYLLAGGHGAELALLASLAADTMLAARAIAGSSHLPRFAEFDGLVIRQWRRGTEQSEDGVQYFVAVDDGTSAQAWAFPVAEKRYAAMPPGMLVHVRVDPRLNKLIGIDPIRQLPVAPLLQPPPDPRGG